MAKIQIDKFGGIQPKIANDKLPNETGQVAQALKTATGELVAYRRSTADVLLAGTSYKSFFEYQEGGNNHWVYFDAIVDWVRPPVSNDTFERLYTTGSHASYKAFVNDNISGTFDQSTDFYYPGAPSGTAPTATGYTTGSLYRAYFYTYVSRYGEEGPPSALKEVSDYGSGNVTLGAFEEPVAADNHLTTSSGGGTNKPYVRVYRTASEGDGNASFLLVKEVDVSSWTWATATITDDVADADLGAACPSSFYDRAPLNLTGLHGHPNGFFVAHKDNELHFTEPFKPWAWPEDYRIPIDQRIVGIGVFGSTIVVATDGFTYTFAGPHPESLYKSQLSFKPCLSQRGVVQTNDGVIFPTLEGFQKVSANGMVNITEDMFKPEDWINYELDTMHGTWYDGNYYGFYRSGDYEGGIILDFVNGSITTGLEYHNAGYVAISDGTFRTIYNSNLFLPDSLYISRWDANPEEYRNFTWKSKLFLLEKPRNFAVAQVILDDRFYDRVLDIIDDSGDLESANAAAWNDTDFGVDLGGPLNEFQLNEQEINGDNLVSINNLGVYDYVEFRLYVDGVHKYTKLVRKSNMFKLPRGFKSKQWEVELVGMIPVKRVTMATSTEEIV